MQYMLTVYEMNYSNQSIRTGAHEARIDKWKQAHPSPPPPYIVVICCHISATKIDEEDFKVPKVGNFSLLAWFLNDYFASFFSLSNVGIDRPSMPSTDVITLQPGSILSGWLKHYYV